MTSKIEIFLASNDMEIIETFDRVVKEKKYNMAIFNTIESFIQSWTNTIYDIAVLDISLFTYHKMNIVDVLNIYSSDLKVITIAPGDYVSDIEKNMLTADIAPKIIYRIVKPVSYEEMTKILEAAIDYVAKCKDDWLKIDYSM